MILLLVAAAALSASVFLVVYSFLRKKPDKKITGDVFLQLQHTSDSAAAKATVGAIDRALSKTMRDKTAMKLSVAGLKFRPAEWLVLQIATCLVVGVLGMLMFDTFVGVLFSITGLVALRVWLSFRVSSNRKKFEEELADMLQLVSGSLRSGLSLAASLGVVAADGKGPIQTEINRVLSKSRLGIPLEDSFDEVAERMDSQDFSWVALAVRIQKEVGGSLADVLKSTSDTIRERAYLSRQVKALSAEGRLSAYILFALPIGMALWTILTRREFISVMWTTKFGLVLSSGTALLMCVGLFWMKKTVKVDV